MEEQAELAPEPAARANLPAVLLVAEALPLATLAAFLLLTHSGAMPDFPGLHLALYAAWPLLAGGAALLLRRGRTLLQLPMSLLIGLLVLMAAFYVNFRAVRVEGDSMTPTLQPGDVLLMDLTAAPDARMGIYVLDVKGEKHNPLIKRLVGLPGEDVDVRYGRVFANELEVYPRDGTPPDEWNENRPAYARFYNGALHLGEDEYFFLGDNPPDSRDSRAFGPVTGESIEGRVIWSLRGSHGFGHIG